VVTRIDAERFQLVTLTPIGICQLVIFQWECVQNMICWKQSTGLVAPLTMNCPNWLKELKPRETVLTLIFLTSLAPHRVACQLVVPNVQLGFSNAELRLSISGSAGSSCTIQTATNLFPSEHASEFRRGWDFVTNFTLSESPFTITNALAPGAMSRFYRVYAALPPGGVLVTNLTYIPPGAFTMGSPEAEAERYSIEGPQTQVFITEGFWVGKYEVTQAEFAALMSNNPSWFNGLRYDYDPTCSCYRNVDYGTNLARPVEQVSWNDAVAYCSALTQRERDAGRLPTGYSYRLPTEAEWEYACRAEISTAFYYGSALRSGMANFVGTQEYDSSVGTTVNRNGAYLHVTVPGGRYAPNALGLYDMHCNIREWCSDWLSETLPGGVVTDPKGPPTGTVKILRGGSWREGATSCRSAYRGYASPDLNYVTFGFRLVLAPVHP